MFEFAEQIQRIAVMAVPFLLAVTCHELAHGLAALWYGDPTAKQAGRLTLNPLPHLDPMGTLVFVITAMTGGFIIGWAKPVPVNPRHFRNVRQGLIVVSAAGAAANALLAVLFLAAFSLLRNNIPAPGSFLEPYFDPLYLIAQFGVVINVVLAVFNLLPIPPLDGSKILAELLPPAWAWKYMQLERYGLIIIVLLVVTGALRFVFQPVWALLNHILF
ncbi:site-2 protease family protein [Desulfocurvus sp.]|jgi:Zn-dependent protease|uniref:site-2 protease family protein n=1 Tax=Desulfocurvus sp. TaxID=2871698 RepID=UPI0025C10FCE|nr:site-2 protease family protein [Desulfocurvus sp.]MCK9239116.1 site-2 protease family protein [Desulfocurvus sp.]